MRVSGFHTDKDAGFAVRALDCIFGNRPSGHRTFGCLDCTVAHNVELCVCRVCVARINTIGGGLSGRNRGGTQSNRFVVCPDQIGLNVPAAC